MGVGSNIAPKKNILLALPKLEKLFSELRFSPIYESPAHGFDGDNFLNFVVSAYSEHDLACVVTALKHIEFEQGRKPNDSKCSSRYIDIDILMFGDLCGQFDSISLPRADILQYDFVLKPLADLCPKWRHPLNNRTFEQLWLDYQTCRAVNLRLSAFQLADESCRQYAVY